MELEVTKTGNEHLSDKINNVNIEKMNFLTQTKSHQIREKY